MMNKGGYVYILASARNGTLYIGVTASLEARHWQHANPASKSFTQKYKVTKLVYYEQHDDIGAAILREAQMKRWERKWKLNLIEQMNPDWNDLSLTFNA